MKPTCVRITLLLFLSGFLTGNHLHAQVNPIYQIEANIVYHFTKYVNWPDQDQPGDFVIGVIGNSPAYDEMMKLMDTRTAYCKRITIKKFPANSAGFACQILFITEEARACLKRVAGETAALPVLIVSEGAGQARKGASIDLALSDEHLKLEINKTNIERHKLEIASELLELGTIVN